MKRNLVVVITALALASAGCKSLLKKREPDPAASQAPAAPPLPVAPSAAPVVEASKPVTDDAVPTPEDFEDEAFEKVTSATYAAELERLKKEIEE